MGTGRGRDPGSQEGLGKGCTLAALTPWPQNSLHGFQKNRGDWSAQMGGVMMKQPGVSLRGRCRPSGQTILHCIGCCKHCGMSGALAPGP